MSAITMVRIYIREGDRVQGHDLMREIFDFLHGEHRVHGLTVFRGVAGFGAKGEVHAEDLLRLNVHLPLVLEFFDSPERASAVLPGLRAMVPASHIVTWDADCLDAPA